VRIFEIDESGKYETKTVTFSELCGSKVKNKPKFFIYSYVPTSVSQVTTAVKEISIVAAAIFGTAKLIKAAKKRKNK
jgi:hypothetical protein